MSMIGQTALDEYAEAVDKFWAAIERGCPTKELSDEMNDAWRRMTDEEQLEWGQLCAETGR